MADSICNSDICDNELPEGRFKYCGDKCAWRAGNQRRSAKVRLSGLGSKGPDTSKRIENLTAIEKFLTEAGVPIDEIGSVKGVTVKQWQAVAKGAATRHPETGRVLSQEPSKVVDLESTSILISPSWDEGPKWELPKPPTPIKVQLPKQRGPTLLKGWKTALILPDPQFGYRRDLYTGELDPFHDLRALSVALQISELIRPDLSIWLGDVLDFAPFGKYVQEPTFALTVQPTLETTYEYLAKFAATSRETRFIEGNHDVRLQNYIVQNAKAAFGIKRAGAPPAEWPVMSVPFLLNLDQLGIKYVGGYPAGATYINDNLAAIHGTRIGNKTKSAASMIVEDERVSVVCGHVHRIETRYRTRNSRGAPKFSMAHTPGCLARIDGAVPSVKGGVDAFGHPVKSWEDWQHGLSVIQYQEGDGKFALETIPIFEGNALYRGQEFIAS